MTSCELSNFLDTFTEFHGSRSLRAKLLRRCPSSDNSRDTDRLGLESFWALFIFTGAASTSVLFIFKARLFPRYGHQTRTRMKLWRSKHFRSMKVRQISRRHSTSLKRTAPEPAADDLPVVLEHHNDLGNLPEKNNL